MSAKGGRVKILYFADTRFPIERANGVQTMATCHALAARGHDVTLVARPDTASPPRDAFDFYGFPRLPKLRIETIAGPRSPRARRAQFLLGALRRLVTSRAVVVYTRDLGLAAFFLQVPRSRRPPIIYESHGVSVIVSAEMPALLGKPHLAPSHEKLRRLERRERRVWQRAEAYVTITQALQDELTSRYGSRDRVFVVPDGAMLDDEPASGTASAAPEKPIATAGYAGHLYPWKGVDDFVRALAQTSDIRGLIVGGHPGEHDYARVNGLIRDLGLAERVEMTGLVMPWEVRRRLATATMLVMPNAKTAVSERYTSPLKLFEYLSMGLPIVASDLPSVREVLTDGETALLVPPGEPAALAAAMSRLAANAALSEKLGRAARALAPEYTWARRAERLEAALTAATTRR
jgi:glycosyltransferase involved in cell wall biosynthesis